MAPEIVGQHRAQLNIVVNQENIFHWLIEHSALE
jgi:hypothetical protein